MHASYASPSLLGSIQQPCCQHYCYQNHQGCPSSLSQPTERQPLCDAPHLERLRYSHTASSRGQGARQSLVAALPQNATAGIYIVIRVAGTRSKSKYDAAGSQVTGAKSSRREGTLMAPGLAWPELIASGAPAFLRVHV